MKNLCAILFLMSSFAAAQSGLVVQQWSLGPAGQTVTLGAPSDSLKVSVVVGQGLADAPKLGIPATGDPSNILPGFWIEVATASSPSNTNSESSVHMSTSPIAAAFHGSQVNLNFQVAKSQQASARVFSLGGAELGTVWAGVLPAGASAFQIQLPALAKQSVLLVIDAGNARKTYQFVPQK